MDQITQPPLTRYIIGVLVAWVIVLCLSWIFGGAERFRFVAAFCAGFLFGMLAMYIAVHLYAWR